MKKIYEFELIFVFFKINKIFFNKLKQTNLLISYETNFITFYSLLDRFYRINYTKKLKKIIRLRIKRFVFISLSFNNEFNIFTAYLIELNRFVLL